MSGAFRAWIGAVLVAGGATTASPAQTLDLSSDLRIRVEDGRTVLLEARAWKGEGYAEVARRIATPEAVQTIRTLNREVASPADAFLRVPLELLSGDYRMMVIVNLFAKDRRDGADWIHVARSGTIPTYDEGLWQVAAWFCGDGNRFDDLRKANGLASPELAAGQEVRIPAAMLHADLRLAPTSDDGSLVYGKDAEGDYAGYRLKAGEALYSAVVLRFTEVTAKDDVEAFSKTLARRSGIRDLTDIPVGFLVKIPLDALGTELLPKNDPRRVRGEADRVEIAEELSRRPPPVVRDHMKGVVVIIDPGHGGQDLGTIHNGVWEHDYVYDVACRLKRAIETGTAASVRLTLLDEGTGLAPSQGDELVANRQGTLQTSPRFLAQEDGDTSVGVNLRWYLANSIYRQAIQKGVPADRIVFVSLHADSRHPSLRGAMVYVPGSDYRGGTYGSTSSRYMRFREVREKPTISFSRRERIRSEAVSRSLASKIVRAFRKADLPVQEYRPVRERVIRGGSSWLPAVLRGNAVPTKVLVEMLNLSNEDDAMLLHRAADRERLASALSEALIAYFGQEPAVKGGAAASSR